MFVLACCVCTMRSIVLRKTKAICLLFLTSFVLAATGDDEIYFTTGPKNKEAFVGEDVQFDWEYARTDVQEVRFGLIVNGSDMEVAIYVRKKDGTTIINKQSKEVEGMRDRVEIVPDRRASFKIKKVQMKDAGTYYCALIIGGNSFIDRVKLAVVDLMIDKIASSKTVESWAGRRITVVCAARVPAGITNPKFSWMHIPSNTTVAKEYHDDIRSISHLMITTYKDQDFEALQCTAETKTTVKFHIIHITKLSSPSPPRNLMAKRSFDKENARPYILLHWDPPKNNGGAVISGYILSYIMKGLPWKDATREETEDNQINGLKLPNGNIYYAVVRAKNKAGTSAPSNQIEINLEDYPHLSSINAGTQHHNLESLLLLWSFVVTWLL